MYRRVTHAFLVSESFPPCSSGLWLWSDDPTRLLFLGEALGLHPCGTAMWVSGFAVDLPRWERPLFPDGREDFCAHTPRDSPSMVVLSCE